MFSKNILIALIGTSAFFVGSNVNADFDIKNIVVEKRSSIVSPLRSGSKLDLILRSKLAFHEIEPVVPPPAQDPAVVALGEALFFDKEISGRRNIACSTCHHPLLGSADGQSQSRGQGTIGLGPNRRQDGDEFFEFLPRNALSLWNRGTPEWTVMFWDGRLSGTAAEGFISPAGDLTPQNFSSALAAFGILPITPDQEMRGFPGQLDVFGQPNPLGDLTNSDFLEIWELVTARITDNSAYDALLANAFPGIPESELDISNLSEAMGAFMTVAFTALNSPFDKYLAGDNSAMSDSAKRGAILFYGRANCVDCHAGGLQTDFDFHNIAAPQVGTGRAEFVPLDLGRGAITGIEEENFKFRTPSLRNIELEAPYFHNGAFARLEDAVRHHLDPATSLATYDDSQVEFELAGTFQDDPNLIDTLLDTLSPRLVIDGPSLREREIQDIMAFLSALTDPASLNMLDVVPDSVPSGLPLAD